MIMSLKIIRKVNWIYQFIFVKGTEEYIDISYKEFNIASTLVSNFSIIPHLRVFFCFIVHQTQKKSAENNNNKIPEKVDPIQSHAKIKKTKSSKEYDVACFQRF